EVDDLGEIPGTQAANEADRRFLCLWQLGLHAGARVEQKRQRDGKVALAKVGDVLLDAVLEDVEVRYSQIRDETPGAVDDGDVERHEIDPRPKSGPLHVNRRGLLCLRCRI